MDGNTLGLIVVVLVAGFIVWKVAESKRSPKNRLPGSGGGQRKPPTKPE